MPLREFSRLTARLLDHLGEQAVLRGGTATAVRCKANIEHGVDFADANDQAIYSRSIATIDKQYLPEKGDTLDQLDANGNLVIGRFTLDLLLRDNGYNRAFVLVGR